MTHKKKQKLICFAAAIFLLPVIVVFAAYVTKGYQKAVIATAKKSIPFSSNYLRQMEYAENKNESFANVSPILTYGEDTITFPVTVNNYSLTNASVTANGLITYNAAFQFEGLQTYTDCKIKYGTQEKLPDETGKVTFMNTLQTGRNSHTYIVSIPQDSLGKVNIRASVIPDAFSLSLVSNKMLAANLVPAKTSGQVGFDCKGVFSDAESAGKKLPYDYSAFRYFIEINSGKANVTLRWKKDYVELDPGFVDLLKNKNQLISEQSIPDAEGYKSITFLMDYSEMSTLNTIFYRVEGRNPASDWQKDWKKLDEIVEVSAEEIKNN